MVISIHAPCEGGDDKTADQTNAQTDISIHAPCEGGDLSQVLFAIGATLFQSTPPVKGATVMTGHIP